MDGFGFLLADKKKYPLAQDHGLVMTFSKVTLAFYDVIL